ncbi:MAG: signal peptidase I [Anaerolineaceae bacterium]|nr:signal peptidase I [Anaerolineaceae bacterium]
MSFPPENIPPEEYPATSLPEETSLTEQQPQSPSIGRIPLDVVETLVLAFALYCAIDAVLAQVRVVNISMLPTYLPGEFVMVNKLAYKFGEMERGDIVIFHYNESEDYVKRVIGLPGDEVEVRDGIVYISGRPMIETYLNEVPSYVGKWNVPEGKLFVLGDNRNQSSDSHSWGFVSVDEVVGRAVMIYWPPPQIRFFARE